MAAMKRLAAALLFLTACSRHPRARERPPGAALPVDAGASAAERCVAECVAAAQMRAVSAEQIESECRRECGRAP